MVTAAMLQHQNPAYGDRTSFTSVDGYHTVWEIDTSPGAMVVTRPPCSPSPQHLGTAGDLALSAMTAPISPIGCDRLRRCQIRLTVSGFMSPDPGRLGKDRAGVGLPSGIQPATIGSKTSQQKNLGETAGQG